MKLAISNIGWAKENDASVYNMMTNNGFTGLEIAPTRIFSEQPYDHLDDARAWSDQLKSQNGFIIPSMQSIWYGRTEKLFGTDEERATLVDYTKKAIDFAEAVGCKNLVFRPMPPSTREILVVHWLRVFQMVLMRMWLSVFLRKSVTTLQNMGQL